MKTLIPLFLVAALTTVRGQAPRLLDRIIAVIDREIITEADLNSQVEFFVFNNRVDPETPGLKKQVLESMINEKLILAKAVEESVVVTDEEITQQLEALIQQRIQQAGSERKLEEIYGMSISRMKREFRDEMRKQLLASKLQQQKFANIQVSRREVEEFFQTYRDSLPQVPEEVELYHLFILPKPTEEAKSAIRRKAQMILDSLRAGGDFPSFARRYSDDPGSASSGGDLGFIRRGQLVKEFEEVVFALKEKQFSNPVETSFGIHIIQLLERRGESVHARHILFKIGQDPTAEERAIDFLKSVKDSVESGRSFMDLARLYSDDKETAPLGGYLGTFTVDQLEPGLLDTIRAIKPGEISGAMRVSFGGTIGFHIVYLKKRILAHPMNLVADWKRIEQVAANFKRNKEYQRWMTELKRDIYWEVRL